MSVVIITTFAVLSVIGVPLAVSMALGAAAGLFLSGSFPLHIFSQTIYTAMDNFLMVAVPLFVLAGKLMEHGGIARRIFDFADRWTVRLRGGLGHVNIIASFIFGGISGSSVADAASLGRIEVVEMTRRGYPIDYSAALSMASSALATVVPPSILMVVAGAAAGESIARLLIAGIGPGLLFSGLMMLVNYAFARAYGYGSVGTFDLHKALTSTLDALPALLAPGIIVGGIVFGYYTPTEAAAIAVLYSAVVGILIYRELPLKALPRILVDSAKTSGTVLLIAATAKTASWLFTMDGVPQGVTGLVMSVGASQTLVLLVLVMALVLIGMFMDAMAALLILVPLLYPIGVAVGINGVHLVTLIVSSLAFGLITPPVGVCLYAMAAVSGRPIEVIAKAGLAFYAVLFIGLLLIAYVPAISLFLPGLVLP